jgi:putative endonuclease
MAEHNEIGKWGEDLAVDYLLSKGYVILQRNYRFERAEIDIIAEFENELVITEVKTRKQFHHVELTDIISQRQQSQIIHSAEGFIQENEIELDARFDIILILWKGKNHTLKHIKYAFYSI